MGKEYAHVPFLLHLLPNRQPKAVRDVFVCTKASARLLRNTLIKVGHDGAKPFNLYPSPRRTHHYREQISIQDRV
jgi:hypothetical protein